MSEFFTPSLSALEPYTPGEQPQEKTYIKLNTNESPFAPSPRVLEAVNRAEMENLRLYSDPASAALCRAIADRFGLAPENVVCGNGSDELLSFAIRAFCDAGRALACPDITYGFYKVWCRLWGVENHVIPLKEDFSLDAADYEALGETILIANPNAPTGRALPRAQIERLLQTNPNSVVIVDEAYVDFGGESCVPLIQSYPNLLVVQTCSKSRSLAGARLGFALGQKALIEDLNRIRCSFNPYNINRLTAAAGIAAMQDEEYLEKCTAAIVQSRAWTTAQLRALGFAVQDSLANFVFARCPAMPGGQLYAQLKKAGILVRHFDAPRTADWLRITIGSQSEMESLIEAVKRIIGKEQRPCAQPL